MALHAVGHSDCALLPWPGSRPEGGPPEQVLNVASGLCSQRQDDGHWLSRCMAFGIEWSWIGDAPAAQMLAPLPLPRLPAPDNVIAHPFFAAALRTAGSAS